MFILTNLSKPNLPTLVYKKNRGNVILAYKVLRANTLLVLFPTVGTNQELEVTPETYQAAVYYILSLHSILFIVLCQQLEQTIK